MSITGQERLQDIFERKGFYRLHGNMICVYQCCRCDKFFTVVDNSIDKAMYCPSCRRSMRERAVLKGEEWDSEDWGCSSDDITIS